MLLLGDLSFEPFFFTVSKILTFALVSVCREQYLEGHFMNAKDRKTDQRAQDYTNLNGIMLLSTMCTERI